MRAGITEDTNVNEPLFDVTGAGVRMLLRSGNGEFIDFLRAFKRSGLLYLRNSNSNSPHVATFLRPELHFMGLPLTCLTTSSS